MCVRNTYIEVDSDSDFAPGAYVPEVSPKKRAARGPAAGPSTTGTKRKRASRASGASAGARPSKAQKSRSCF
jgi:hypothetical protein